jgi:coenzyme F420-reducing hydrogenase beta subunit
MNEYLISNDKRKCCGCTACVHICPAMCITMHVDDEGFLYPIVSDERKCINCGRCSKVCPMEIKTSEGNVPSAIYAGVIKNNDILIESSSGGAFSAIAEYVFDNNGVVCGCILDYELRAKHIIVDNKAEFAQLRGSKYIQSNMQDIYHDIKKMLEDDRPVLFVGTPCQVAGLRLFLGELHHGLIAVDLICHGVPSQMFFDSWVDTEEKNRKTKIKNIKFREKGKYGWGHIISYETATGKKIIQPPSINSYYYAYLNALNYRETCYVCPFTTIQRTGDLTIADFWGIEKEKNFIDKDKGVSMILVNTNIGQSLLKKLDATISLYSCSPMNIDKRQDQLRKPVSRPNLRSKIYGCIKETSYGQVEKRYLRSKFYLYYLFASKIPERVRNFIKK